MKKLVFDFDGTLVDSMKQWAGKMINVLEKNNIDYPDDIIKIITPLGDKGSAEYFINNLGLKLSLEEILEQIDEYAIDAYTYEIITKDTVIETLEELKNRGYSLNVLTASPHKMLDVCLKRNGIYDIFDNVWSCDDFNTTKSDVNIYHMVAEKLGTRADDCVFFDDNINAVKTAMKAGMTGIGVYDESSEDCVEEMKALVDSYIYKLEEFLRL